MKKCLCCIIALFMVFVSLAFVGCNSENKKKADKTAETTSETEQTSANTADKNTQIKEYLDSFVEGDNDFYGAWQPENFSYMSIVFRNDKLAELVTGTEGYFSKYSLDTDAKTLTVQLMPNVIDGIYKYEFSDDKQKLTLTLDDNTIVLIKQKDFSMLPDAPKEPKTDSDILGWWENEEGMFYCFQNDGIMYENSISMETCYTYSAQDGKISAVYTSSVEMTDDFTYSFEDGVLTLNGSKCTKKDMR